MQFITSMFPQRFPHCPGVGRSELSQEVPGQQLPNHHPREPVRLHDAHPAGSGLEPDSVQPVRPHQEGVRNQIH